MASKKAGRLAGLAALAGLAYMATRDKGGTKAASAPAAKDARTYAEVHEGEDAQAGINMGTSAGRKMGEEMLARGEKEGKIVDGSDQGAGPTKIKDTEFGDLEGAMKAQANAPAKVAPAKAAVSKKAPSASVTKAAPMRAKSMDELHSSYVPDTRYKLRDTRFTYDNDPNRALYSNKALKQIGAEERPESEERKIFGKKRGGVVKKMASGGMTSSASKRGDGIATKGKTRGRMC